MYCSRACTSPTETAPAETRRPPTTAMITNCRLPMNSIAGWIRLEVNWARKLAS